MRARAPGRGHPSVFQPRDPLGQILIGFLCGFPFGPIDRPTQIRDCRSIRRNGSRADGISASVFFLFSIGGWRKYLFRNEHPVTFFFFSAQPEYSPRSNIREYSEKKVAHRRYPLLPPVRSRHLRDLTKHATDAEADTYKRLAAACAAVGPGEVGDFAHADALRAAFNDISQTSISQPAKKSWKKSSSSEKSGGFTPSSFTSSSDAFVATTPGAAGHAALLNLRHSFLWVKTEREAATKDDDADQPPRGPNDDDRPILASATATPMKRDVATETGVMVMEPYLRAHFVISRPTERYQRLLDTLPPHFVGAHERLARLVDFMSEQMLASFKERGMPVPPWRQNKSILSKWFLPTAKSVSTPPTPSGSPPMSNGSKGRSTGRRASVNFDVVGGRGVFFGVGYGTPSGLGKEPYESSRGVEKVAMGSLSSSMRLLRDAMIA